MLSIDDYIDAALKELKLTSQTGLCKALDLSTTQVSYWRKRKSIPSDETMAKLAKLANTDVDLALLHLSWWRSVSRDEHTAARHYKRMIDHYHPIAA